MKTKDIYLVARYYAKPKEYVRTQISGWMDDPSNIRYDEEVGIVNGLKKRDQQARIILNLSKKRVEQNNWTGERDFDRLFLYFYEGYSDYLVRAMNVLDPDYIGKVTKKDDKVEPSTETTSS